MPSKKDNEKLVGFATDAMRREVAKGNPAGAVRIASGAVKAVLKTVDFPEGFPKVLRKGN